jgi:Leucine-rich repeat (LRR) protein
LKALPLISIPYSEIISIDLSYNLFTTIPEEIFKMTNLESLRISCNSINTVPSDIGKLKKLNYLSLMTNNISKIPKEILELKNLKQLLLGFNPITELPVNFNKNRYELYSFGTKQYINQNLTNIEEPSENVTTNNNTLPSYDEINFLPSYDEINLFNNRIYLPPPKYDEI